MAKVLGVILGLRKQGQYEDAQEAITEAYTEFFQLSSAEMDNAGAEGLPDFLRSSRSFGPGQMGMLADLLNEEAALLDAQGKRSEASLRYNQALQLFKEENREQATVFSLDRNNKIAFIEKRLKEFT